MTTAGGDQRGVFTGLTAWFSCSVNPSTVKLWGNAIYNTFYVLLYFLLAEQYGGVLVGESEAMYLFSDDAFTQDTTRYKLLFYREAFTYIFQALWVAERHSSGADVMG